MKSFYILFVLLIHSGVASAQQYLIATVAGTGGSPGWSGDLGPALNAQFTNPLRVALDAQGDLYITDYSNQSVRRIDANTDVITTVAGNGFFGYSGDGITADGAQLADPHDVVVDAAGNVYIADTRNSRVRIVNLRGLLTPSRVTGRRVTRVTAASTSAQLMFPSGLALDKAGNLYIADYGNATVRRVDKNGNISTFAGSDSPPMALRPATVGWPPKRFSNSPTACKSTAPATCISATSAPAPSARFQPTELSLPFCRTSRHRILPSMRPAIFMSPITTTTRS